MDLSRIARRGAMYLGLAPDDARAAQPNGRASDRDRDDLVVIVVFVPAGASADAVRRAASEAGAGAIGEYRACSFSTAGDGRFEPIGAARPAIGEVGRSETVIEERIEVVAPRYLAGRALRAMLAAHPYEEPAHHVYATINPRDL